MNERDQPGYILGIAIGVMVIVWVALKYIADGIGVTPESFGNFLVWALLLTVFLFGALRFFFDGMAEFIAGYLLVVLGLVMRMYRESHLSECSDFLQSCETSFLLSAWPMTVTLLAGTVVFGIGFWVHMRG